MSEAVALVVLAACLAAAVTRPSWAPDWAVAAGGAVLLVVVGIISVKGAREALGQLGPTVGFLAALLVLADGCRRAGMFDALGAWMAVGSRGQPRRLLAMVFLAAAVTTAVLSLDATVVLLTPIVFATAARLRTNARPHVYACTHLANSASLLLPVSNLTNLLAFRASGLSFARFGSLMVLPWLVATGGRMACPEPGVRGRPAPAGTPARPRPVDRPELPTFPLAVVGLTLVGFALSSLIGIAPVWVATAGAVAMVVRERPDPRGAVARGRAGLPGLRAWPGHHRPSRQPARAVDRGRRAPSPRHGAPGPSPGGRGQCRRSPTSSTTCRRR